MSKFIPKFTITRFHAFDEDSGIRSALLILQADKLGLE